MSWTLNPFTGLLDSYSSSAPVVGGGGGPNGYVEVTLGDMFGNGPATTGFLWLVGEPGLILVDWGDGTVELVEITKKTFTGVSRFDGFLNWWWFGGDYGVEEGDITVSLPGFIEHTYAEAATERKIKLVPLGSNTFALHSLEALEAYANSYEVDPADEDPDWVAYFTELGSRLEDLNGEVALLPVASRIGPGFAWESWDALFVEELFASGGWFYGPGQNYNLSKIGSTLRARSARFMFAGFIGTEIEEFDTSKIVDFGAAWDHCTNLTSFPLLDVSSGTNFEGAWNGCGSLTSFPLLDVSSGTNFEWAWSYCTNLTSFPPLDVGSGRNFMGAWRFCINLTSFPLLDVSSGTNFEGAWMYCANLTSFPLLDVSSGTKFGGAWAECTGLTSFPLLDVSSGTNFVGAWDGCGSLTSFPLLDVSSGTNFERAWAGCAGLTSFPLIDLHEARNLSVAWSRCTGLTEFPQLDISNVTSIDWAWQHCTGLTSFPFLDTSSVVSADGAWNGCTGLVNFPANFFDGCPCINFWVAFKDTSLNQQSVDNILISIESNGTSSGTLTIDGANCAAPSATGLAAKSALIARGWSVTTK